MVSLIYYFCGLCISCREGIAPCVELVKKSKNPSTVTNSPGINIAFKDERNCCCFYKGHQKSTYETMALTNVLFKIGRTSLLSISGNSFIRISD